MGLVVDDFAFRRLLLNKLLRKITYRKRGEIVAVFSQGSKTERVRISNGLYNQLTDALRDSVQG